MHTLIYTSTDDLLAWAGQAIGTTFDPSAKAIGLRWLGKLRAVSVFDHFSDGDCAIHVASNGSRRWLTRHFLVASFAYPFLERRQRRLTSLIPATNIASYRFCTNLGFRVEGCIREGASPPPKEGEGPIPPVVQAGAVPGDLIVLGMLKDECRWIRPEFLRRVKEHTYG